MKKIKMFRHIQLLIVVVILSFSIPVVASAEDFPTTTYDIRSIPIFEEYVWVTLDKNQPIFPEELLTTTPYVQLSPLDEFGRPGAAIACLGPETIMADYDYLPTRDSYKCFWQVVFSQFGKIKCRIWQLQKSEFGKGSFEPKKFGKQPFAAEILPTSQ